MQIGLISDLHGDFNSFQKALALFETKGVHRVLCLGDVSDRGPDADKIIEVMKARQIPCVAGNHDRTVVSNQAHWRDSAAYERLQRVGRIVSDESIAYLKALPDTVNLTRARQRILMAHGAPWSDVVSIFHDSRQAMYQRLHRDYATATDIILLGHTHAPMHVVFKGLHIINPGSVYGVTLRDSHTCAVMALPYVEVTLYDLITKRPTPLERVLREVTE